jgi:VWFA-related protein
MNAAVNRADRPTKRGAALLTLAILWVFSSAPLCPAQNQTPSYRVTTRLVELTVVALDKNGNPVTDLQTEDFAAFDNGKPRNLSLCRYEGAPGPQAAKRPVLPQFVFSNRFAPDAADNRNITALVLDSANTDPRDQMFVMAHTARLLRALAPQTRVAIYQLGNELRIIHDFTDDMAALRAHLEQLNTRVQTQHLSDVEQAALDAEAILDQIEARKTPYATAVFRAVQAADKTAIAGDVNSNTVIQRNRVEETLALLEGLGRHLAAVPGRKSVVWISGGISLFSQRTSTTPDDMPVNPMAGDNLENVIRKTSERLAQLGVVLYGVDAHGLTSSAESLAQRQYPPMLAGRYSEMERAAAANADSRAAFSLITSITGGRFIFGTNDLSEGVNKVAGDLHGSYSIGFYAPEEPDGKWHTLKVDVRRSDVRLLHKQGYLADPSPVKQQTWDAEAERQALMSPFGSDAIRLTARCAPAAGTEPGTLLLTLQIEAEDLFWREESGRMAAGIDIYITENTADGQVRFQHSRINARFLPPQMDAARAQGLPFRRQWKPGADTRTIRVLVRDAATGRLGTIDIPMSQDAGNK